MNPDFTHETTAPASDASGEQDVTIRVDVRATLPPGLEQPGDMIGRYKLIEPLGEGGFGSVWQAEQFEPIHREVALKVIKAGMDSKEIIARFAAERQALAMMDHPNIAAVLDAGTTEGGRPFFAMELVKGVPLTEFCDARKLTIRERLELFIPVCQAVQHAHQKAILHRDLKPSNILVVEVDGKAVPKVIDFGIAKALGGAEEQAFQASLARTQAGMIIGTPQYMSPEQAGAKPDLDTRSDIYTLGVILYELLVGDTPLGREQMRKAAKDEIMRLVREVDAKRPSSRLLPVTEAAQTAAQHRQSDTKRLSNNLRGDLDWIVLKTLEKDRSRRYETANALALDLQRHLHDEPVSAGPPSAGYRLKKLVRRNKAAFSAGAAIILLILAGLVSSTLLYLREKEARNRAQVAEQSALTEAKRSAEVAEFMQNIFRGINPETARGKDTELLKILLARADKSIGKELSEHPEVEADLRNTISVVYSNLGLKEESLSHAERALELRRQVLGPEHPDTLQSMVNVGSIRRDQGRDAEAAALLTEAMQTSRRVLGAGHTRTLFAVMHLASFLQSKGRLDEAEALAVEALEVTHRNQKTESRDALALSSRLASILHSQGRLMDAEELYKKTLEAKKRIFGPEDPSTLITMAGLADLHKTRGRLDEAEQLQGRVLEIQHRVLGADHITTLTSAFKLAKLYFDQKKYAEAEKLYTHGWELLRRQPDLKFPELPDVLADYAYTLRQLKKNDRAEGVLMAELEARSQTGKPKDVNYGTAALRLGVVRMHLNRLVDAEEAVREAHEVMLRSNPESWRRYQCESYLGRLLWLQNRVEEAEPLLMSGYEGMKERFNAKPPSGDKDELILATSRLARLSETKGDAEAAKKWQSEADKLRSGAGKSQESDQ